MTQIPASELILNSDGSIYHLNLLPTDIAHKIIFVGDQDRVSFVSKHFDTIRVKKQKREFVTHTGSYQGKEITVISTGIGTDNIDIVINELDALVNIDLQSRVIKQDLTSLEIIRIGTSGSIQPEIGIDSVLVSKFAIGMDGMMPFYEFQNSIDESNIVSEFYSHFTKKSSSIALPYCFAGNEDLINKFSEWNQGITLTHNGFYAPQGRELRGKRKLPNYIELMQNFNSDYGKITNFEMETAGIYGLSKILGHKALSLNLILANRPRGEFSTQYNDKMEELILEVLNRF